MKNSTSTKTPQVKKQYVPYSIRRAVAFKSKGCCFHCNKKAAKAVLINGLVRFYDENGKSFEIDHKVAIRWGGKTTEDNCVLSCQHCNRSKHAISDDDYAQSMKLINEINRA